MKGHVKFEKENTKLSYRSQKEEGDTEIQQFPEVLPERYYRTTDALNIGKGEEFSLRTLFKPNKDLEVAEEDLKQNPEQAVSAKNVSRVIVKPQSSKIEQQGYWKNAGMWHEPLFFFSGDARFKEGLDFIRCKTKEESYYDRNKWFEQRENLKQFYRNKMRRHVLWMTESSQQPHKKRPLIGAADESSYHFHGQQDEIERQKKKKPHRPYFK